MTDRTRAPQSVEPETAPQLPAIASSQLPEVAGGAPRFTHRAAPHAPYLWNAPARFHYPAPYFRGGSPWFGPSFPPSFRPSFGPRFWW